MNNIIPNVFVPIDNLIYEEPNLNIESQNDEQTRIEPIQE